MAAIVAIVAVLLPRHQSPNRKAVSSYIVSIDGVEQQMSFSLGRVTAAYRSFVSSKSSAAATAQQLVQAERTLRLFEARVAALETPAPARRLRTLVLSVIRREVGVTHEVRALVAFDPAFKSALKTLQVAAATLSKRLAAVHPPVPHSIRGTKKQIAQAQAAFTAQSNAAAAEQAAAVTAYDTAAAGVLQRIRRLSPPAVLLPGYNSQVAALQATLGAGARLAAELRKPARKNVSAYSRAFTLATRASQSVDAQRAEIAAVKTYDTSVTAIQAAAADVRNEILALQEKYR